MALEGYAAKPRVMRGLVLSMILLYAVWGASVLVRNKQADFNLYYMAAYGFAHGEDIYGANDRLWAELAGKTGITNYAPPYRYPPLTALLVWPLIFLSPAIAAALWLAATAAACIASAWLLGRSLGSHRGMAISLTLALGYVPILTTMNVGQVNGFVLLCLSLSLWGLSRRSSFPVPGLGAAAGAMLKLVPFAHLLYLGWSRRWREFAFGLLALVALFSLALPLIGLNGLESYFRHFLSLGEAGSLVPIGSNQALNGFFSRTLSGRIDPESIRALALGSAGLFVLATVALCWPAGDRKKTTILEFSLITVAINLITPYAWYHQFVLLLIPFVVLTDRAASSPRDRWMLAPLALAYIATDLHGLAWHSFEGKPLLSSMPLFAALTLWGFLASAIIREKRGVAGRRREPKFVPVNEE